MPTDKIIIDSKFKDGISGPLGKLGGSIVALNQGLQLLSSVASGVVAPFAAIIKEGKDFNKQMAIVQSVTGTTGDAFISLKEEAKKIGEATQFSAEQAGLAMEALGRAGRGPTDIIKEIGPAMDLAAGTGTDLALAAEAVAKSMTAFTEQGIPARDLADDMVRAVAASPQTFEDLSGALDVSAGFASTLGLSFNDLTVILGTMAKAGVRSEKAGTALNAVFGRLLHPVGEAKKALEELGLTQDEVNPKTNSFREIIETLNKAGADEADLLRLLGQEAGPKFIKMVLTGTGALDSMAEAMRESNSAAEAAAIIQDNLAGDVKSFSSAMSGLMLEIYEPMKPLLRDITKGTTEMVRGFTDFVKAHKTEIKAVFNGIGVAVKAVSSAIWELLNVFGISKRASEDLSGGIKIVTEASEDLESQLVKKSTVPAIMALVNATNAARQATDLTGTALGRIIDMFKEEEDQIKSGTLPMIDEYIRGMKLVINIVLAVGEGIGKIASDTKTSWIGINESVKKSIKSISESIDDFMQSTANVFAPITEASEIASNFIAAKFNSIVDLIIPEPLQVKMKEVFDKIKTDINSIIDKIIQKIEEMFDITNITAKKTVGMINSVLKYVTPSSLIYESSKAIYGLVTGSGEKEASKSTTATGSAEKEMAKVVKVVNDATKNVEGVKREEANKTADTHKKLAAELSEMEEKLANDVLNIDEARFELQVEDEKRRKKFLIFLGKKSKDTWDQEQNQIKKLAEKQKKHEKEVFAINKTLRESKQSRIAAWQESFKKKESERIAVIAQKEKDALADIIDRTLALSAMKLERQKKEAEQQKASDKEIAGINKELRESRQSRITAWQESFKKKEEERITEIAKKEQEALADLVDRTLALSKMRLEKRKTDEKDIADFEILVKKSNAERIDAWREAFHDKEKQRLEELEAKRLETEKKIQDVAMAGLQTMLSGAIGGGGVKQTMNNAMSSVLGMAAGLIPGSGPFGAMIGSAIGGNLFGSKKGGGNKAGHQTRTEDFEKFMEQIDRFTLHLGETAGSIKDFLDQQVEDLERFEQVALDKAGRGTLEDVENFKKIQLKQLQEMLKGITKPFDDIIANQNLTDVAIQVKQVKETFAELSKGIDNAGLDKKYSEQIKQTMALAEQTELQGILAGSAADRMERRNLGEIALQIKEITADANARVEALKAMGNASDEIAIVQEDLKLTIDELLSAAIDPIKNFLGKEDFGFQKDKLTKGLSQQKDLIEKAIKQAGDLSSISLESFEGIFNQFEAEQLQDLKDEMLTVNAVQQDTLEAGEKMRESMGDFAEEAFKNMDPEAIDKLGTNTFELTDRVSGLGERISSLQADIEKLTHGVERLNERTQMNNTFHVESVDPQAQSEEIRQMLEELSITGRLDLSR